MPAPCASRFAPTSAARSPASGTASTPILRSTEPARSGRRAQRAAFRWCPTRTGSATGASAGRAATTRRAPNFDDSPHSLHGVGWLRPWEIVSSSAVEVVLALPPRRRRRLAVRFRGAPVLRADAASLSVQMVFTNTADVAQPVGLGWHPYFPKRAAQPAAHRAVATAGTPTPTQLPIAQGRAARHRQRRRRISISTTASKAGAARRASATRRFSLQLDVVAAVPRRLHAAGARLLLRRAGQPCQQRDPHGRAGGARPAQRRARRVDRCGDEARGRRRLAVDGQ